ncbi:beta strand repeat-containing protein, partial [Desulfovibrio sp. 1214_IL3152]
MILSKNAVGNLINRYKAVLGKCRLLNAFGSLALAAALTLGSAGLAVADPNPQEPGYWTGDVTVDTSIVVNTPFTEAPEGKNITATSITLGEGGSLTLKDGARLINGVPGTDGDAPGYLDFKMTGGDLTLGGGSYDDGINASINARSVDISGGTVNITGKTSATNWYQAAQIGGYRGLTVSGGIVNMNSYSQLFGGGETGLQITGGTINMLGTSSGPDIQNTAAHIMFGGTSNNQIADSAHIVVGSADGSTPGYGVMTTGGGVTMSGGALDVNNGALLLQPDTNGNTGSEALVYNGSATSSFNQTGGTVAVAENGKLILGKGMTYTLGEGGDLELNGGTIQLNNGTHMYLKKGELTGSGGNFVVNGSPSDGYSHLVFSSENFATAVLGGSLSINGGFVSAGDEATLDADQFVASASSAGEIFFGATNSGNLYAEVMTINTAGTIDTFNKGVLTSDTLNIKSASDSVGVKNTTLSLTGKNSILTVTKGDDADATLNLDNNSSLLIGADPNLYSGPKTATINAAVNVNDGFLMVGYDNNSGRTDAATATFTKDVTVGNANAGTLLVTKGSIMSMDEGTTLDIRHANATVNGTLDVTATGSALKTTVTNGVLTVKLGGRLNATSDSLGITGTASTNIGKSLTVEGGGTLKVDNLGTLTLTDLGTLKGNLMGGSGLFDVGSATITDIDATDGIVAYGDVSSLGNTTNDTLRNATVTSVTGTLSGAYAGVELDNTFTSDLVATNTTLQLTGANGGNIVSDSNGDAADVSVGVTGTLVLGDAGSNNSGTVGDVTFTGAGSLLAVGNGSGAFTVGDITGVSSTITASGATLNADTISVNAVTANNGSIGAVGDITLTGAASVTDGNLGAGGDISAASLTATNGSIGAGGDISAASLTATNGSIGAGGDISAASLTATNGSIGAVGDITLTGAANVTDGSLVSQGDITATGGVNAENSSLVAESLTVGADSRFTDGAQVNVGSLTGASGKTITVGNATDTKSTSLVAGNLTLGGGSLLIDPDWEADGPSYVVVGGMLGNEIDGNVGVGQNSLLTIGTLDKGWLAEQVNAVTNGAGLIPGGVTAALGITKPQMLGDGFSIVVDGGLDNAALPGKFALNKATFAPNSLLVVTADAASGPNGALNTKNAAGQANIAANAKLRITGAKVGGQYTVLGDNITTDNNGTGWTGSNFSTDSRMINGSFNAATGVLSTGLNSAANVYPKLDGDLVKVLDNAYTADQVGPAHVDSDVKGVRFLSRATSDNFIGGNADLAAKTIESAARI